MNKIWQVDVRHSTFEHLAYPSDDCEEPITVIHSLRQVPSDSDRAIGIHGGKIDTDVVQSVELTMLREDFEDDYFTWGGCMFVSEKLRSAMALGAPVVDFFAAEDSQSAPLPRSKRYQMMLPLLEDDASDRAKSCFGWHPAQRGNVVPPGEGGNPPYVHNIAIRPDFEPDCDLFYDSFFADTLLCTDAFAVRVLESGCTGMIFVDPIGYREGERQVRRTLTGVEENMVD